MPELNFVSASAEDPDGLLGLVRQPALETIEAGYNYGSNNVPAGVGFMEYGSGAVGTLPFRVDEEGNLTSSGHFSVTGQGGGPPPTAAAGDGDGSSAPAPVVTAGSNDCAGVITFGSGISTMPGSDLLTLTYGRPWAILGGGAPHVVICAYNGVTAQLGLYVIEATADGFTLGAQNGPDDGQAASTYAFSYLVIG